MSLFGTHLDILEQGRQFSHTHWVDAPPSPSSDCWPFGQEEDDSACNEGRWYSKQCHIRFWLLNSVTSLKISTLKFCHNLRNENIIAMIEAGDPRRDVKGALFHIPPRSLVLPTKFCQLICNQAPPLQTSSNTLQPPPPLLNQFIWHCKAPY